MTQNHDDVKGEQDEPALSPGKFNQMVKFALTCRPEKKKPERVSKAKRRNGN